ncbi:hypothetical protein ACHAXT_004271 [Thalassiosira profunda]
MKLLAAITLATAGTSQAFAPTAHTARGSTELAALSRRSVISGFLLGTLAAPNPSHAGTGNPFFEEEVNYEPSQQARGDKIDINGAFVVDYKQLPGMYPSAAGKIASHGPYANVKDIYSIPGATDHDKLMFKRYQAELTALPPGRMFKERINQRQST